MRSSSNHATSNVTDLKEITRYCSAEDIPSLLKLINSAISSDQLQLSAWNSEQSALIKSIQQADGSELKEIHDELNRIEMDRFLLNYSVTTLHRSCTHYRDALSLRALEIVNKEMESSGLPKPGVPYALISMGSDGRKEQTLITDQDNLIVYGDDGGEEADSYFQEFASRLVDKLEQAGFQRCTGGIMPINLSWRGSFSQWRKRLLSIVRYEVEDLGKNMMDLIVLSDARYVAGDQSLAERLIAMIRDMEKDYFQVLWGMAKTATEMQLALGFLKRIWTEGSGEHKGEFNLKLLAWAPLVMNVRILAINQSIPATSTIERISFLQTEGSFSAHFANDLTNAYHVLTKHRILLQIKNIKGIQRDSYYINPYQLPAEEREQIRHALIKIEELQKIIHANFHIV